MKLQHLFIAALALCSSSHGQQSSVEAQAIRCAAMSFIHTSLSASDPEFAEAMANFALFYEGVYAAAHMLRTGSRSSPAELADWRERLTTELARSWATNPKTVVREAALCDAWRAEFGPRMAAAEQAASDAALVRLVGQPPQGPSPADTARWRAVVNQAFSAWLEFGLAAPEPPPPR